MSGHTARPWWVDELLEAARDLELWYRGGGCKHTSPDALMKRLMEAIDKAEGRG